MAEIDLRQKFPDMQPIARMPSLSTMNGFGMRLVGRRGYDSETNSYVATHAFCLLFIPFVAAGAYRVIDAANGGWYILGRVPLSKGKKLWNLSLVVGILAAIGAGFWINHTNSPDYIAGQRIEDADKLAATGKTRQAAEIYRDEFLKTTKHSTKAKLKLAGLIEQPSGSLEETAGVYRVVLDLHRQNHVVVDDLFNRGMTLADKSADADARGALALVEVIAPLAPNPREMLALRRKMLDRLVAANPNDIDLVSRLALVCDLQGDTARCVELLQPHAERLGERDGAAILGRIRAGEGKIEPARALLQPYVRSRLPKLQEAERSYNNAVKRVQDAAFKDLESNNAPGFNRAEYERSSKEQQRNLVMQYLQKRMNEDGEIRNAEQIIGDQKLVISATLDLGMVLLQGAQQRPDPEARKNDLEEAEKLFLGIRGFAGESDDYRINLGQVYYWLGKHSDGRKQFDDLLAARRREPMIVLAVSRILREVGEVTEGRTLAEEAYNKETDERKKHSIAHFRSLMFKDIDDEILWLGRADASAPEVRISLRNARGNKALQEGKDDEAVSHFQDALNAYQSLPENASTLNNSSLVHFSVYRITQDRDQLTRGMDKIDRAVALSPSDSILLLNAASVLLDEAVRDVVGDRIDFKTLKRQRAGNELLTFLYRDEAERKVAIERLRKHPGAVKGRQYCEKLLILAPKNDSGYALLAQLCATLDDVEGLRSLWQRLENVEIDLTHELKEVRDFYAGKDDPKRIDDSKKALARMEAILKETRKTGGATLAVAISSVVRMRMAGLVYGTDVNSDGVVELAEEGYKAAPCLGSQLTLMTALTSRAHRALIKEDRAYAELATKTARSLGSLLLIYALSNDGPFRAKALNNPDVKRVIGIRLEMTGKLPMDRNPTDWATIVALHPTEAKTLASAVAKNPMVGLEHSINRKLSPLGGANALDGYWSLRLAGKDAEANDLIKQFAVLGIPLPQPDMR